MRERERERERKREREKERERLFYYIYSGQQFFRPCYLIAPRLYVNTCL